MIVKLYGPAWAWSAFMFENNNGIFNRMIHETNNNRKKLVINTQILQGVHVLMSRVQAKQTSSCNHDLIVEKLTNIDLDDN